MKNFLEFLKKPSVQFRFLKFSFSLVFVVLLYINGMLALAALCSIASILYLMAFFADFYHFRKKLEKEDEEKEEKQTFSPTEN